MRELNPLNVKELLDELKDAIFFPMLFFYPLKESQEIARPFDFKVLKDANVFDRLILTESPIKEIFLDFDSNVSKLSDKPKILDDNIGDLFNYKEQLNNSSFLFLVTKYAELAYFYSYYTDLLYQLIPTSDNDLFQHYKPFLLLQKKYYQNHFEELKMYFPECPSTFYIDEDFFHEFLSVTQNENKEYLNVDKKDKPKRSPKKPKLITDEEAEVFLLKSIFKVSI